MVVVEGKEDLTIKISDEGGGIPRSAVSLRQCISTESARTKHLHDIDAANLDIHVHNNAGSTGFGERGTE